MLWLLAPTAIALLVAVALGGSPRSLLSTGFCAWPVIVLAFAVELVLYNPPLNAQPWAMVVGPWVWLMTQTMFLSVLIVNGWGAGSRLVWPWRIAALGVGLNTLVIALNGGHMPQSPEAALAVWGASHIDPARLQNVTLLSATSRLPWLADVIAEPTWLPRPNVVSLGDILLSLGVATWAFCGAAPRMASVRVTMGSWIGTPIDGPARPHQNASR